jgi:hypothetical protein
VRARFSTPVQTDPGVHPASCVTDKRVFFAGESGRDVASTAHTIYAEVKERVQLYIYSPLWAFLDDLYLYG